MEEGRRRKDTREDEAGNGIEREGEKGRWQREQAYTTGG